MNEDPSYAESRAMERETGAAPRDGEGNGAEDHSPGVPRGGALPSVAVYTQHYRATKGGIYDYTTKVDGAGDRFDAYLQVNGDPPGETKCIVKKIEHGSGRVMDTW